MTRRFVLFRTEDVSGCSGTGVVADGVQFPDGIVALRWRPGQVGRPTTTLHEDIASVEAIHGHAGRTHVVWLD